MYESVPVCPVMHRLSPESASAQSERVLYGQPTGPNPLNHRYHFSRPALRHGSLNSLSHTHAIALSDWLGEGCHSKCRALALMVDCIKRGTRCTKTPTRDARTFRMIRACSVQGQRLNRGFAFELGGGLTHAPLDPVARTGRHSPKSPSFRMERSVERNLGGGGYAC